VFRRAGEADVVALAELERDASLAALGAVFPPERHPFPFADVLARWRLVLGEPGVTTELVDGVSGPPDVLVAWDAVSVRHLAVRPDRWGEGWGRRALGRAEDAARAAGLTELVLWCLAENHRARGLYEHLGWAPTGEQQPSPWPPYPVELCYRRALRA
jgi:GNAT superfamily N-acetyltransferase